MTRVLEKQLHAPLESAGGKNPAEALKFSPELSLVILTVENQPANTGDVDSIPGSGRSPGEGNGYPLKYSCLGNLIDRGA